jgi:hypothetical protein
MRYSFTVPAADLAIANTPELGGESKRTKISFEEVGLVAEIAMGAPASGTMTPAIPAFDFDDASGNDLVVRAKTAIVSDDDVVLTFGVTFQDNTTGSATASFSVPSYAQNQSSNLPMGLAVDLIGTAGNSGKKVKSADSLTSIAGGSRGNEFQLLALPATWYDVPGITSKVETLNVPKAKVCSASTTTISRPWWKSMPRTACSRSGMFTVVAVARSTPTERMERTRRRTVERLNLTFSQSLCNAIPRKR